MKILTAPQSGSQAGTTASRNRFGQYLRTRGIPVQPRTPKQTRVRASLTASSSAWRLLTVPEQDAWNSYAAGIQRSDSLGQSYQPTGAEVFVGAAIANDGISPGANPPGTSPSYGLLVQLISYTDPTPGPEALDVQIIATNANNLVRIETSGPMSPGITSAAAVRRWVSLPTSAGNIVRNLFAMTANPIPILTEYKFVFPSPLPGNAIWFRFTELFSDGVTAGLIANKQHQTYRLVIP